MDTREIYEQLAVEVLERIAANAAPRISSNAKGSAAGLRDHPYVSLAPRILEERNACIADTAYFIALHRGFSPGHEIEDWLTAENEIDARLTGELCAC